MIIILIIEYYLISSSSAMTSHSSISCYKQPTSPIQFIVCKHFKYDYVIG